MAARVVHRAGQETRRYWGTEKKQASSHRPISILTRVTSQGGDTSDSRKGIRARWGWHHREQSEGEGGIRGVSLGGNEGPGIQAGWDATRGAWVASHQQWVDGRGAWGLGEQESSSWRGRSRVHKTGRGDYSSTTRVVLLAEPEWGSEGSKQG